MNHEPESTEEQKLRMKELKKISKEKRLSFS